MSWRLAIRRKRPPKGWDLVEPKLEEFEDRMREAMNEPVEDKMRNEVTWCVHKIHYQKNRFMFNLYNVEHKISKALYDYLIELKIADGPLLAKWKKPGYETLCSLAVIAKSNTNFRTAGICRVPLSERHGQITPNVMTGCVSCASGDSGPIWWDDPVPEVVMKRRREVLVEEEESERQAERLKLLKAQHEEELKAKENEDKSEDKNTTETEHGEETGKVVGKDDGKQEIKILDSKKVGEQSAETSPPKVE